MKFKKIIYFIWLISTHVLAGDEFTYFDDQILKGRGFDPTFAQQLAKNPRFLSGKQNIKLYLNHQYKGDLMIQVDREGVPCFTSKELSQLNLEVPFLLHEKKKCLNLEEVFENSQLLLRPNAQKIDFLLPEKYIKSELDLNSFTYGGYGGLFNYTMNYMGNDASEQKDIYTVNSELGFNFYNWMFRSAQYYSYQQNSALVHQYAYAQTTLEEYQKDIQIGQINLFNVAGSARVLGVQVSPETLLNQNAMRGGAVVNGYANEPSVVEIYQLGRLIYSTAVPAGEFKLNNFNLPNKKKDLNVSVKGVNGSQNNFVVPASTFTNSILFSKTGMSFGMGRYDSKSSDENPFIIALAKNWNISPLLNLMSGILFSENYYVSAVGSDVLLLNNIVLNLAMTLSHNDIAKKTGGEYSTTVNYLLDKNLNISMNALVREKDFSYLTDTVSHSYDSTISNQQKQFGVGLNWSNEKIGGVSLFFSQNFGLQDHQDYFSLTWSKMMTNYLLLSLNSQLSYNQDNEKNTNIYFRISMPLDRSNLSTTLSRNGNQDRLTAQYNDYQNQDRTWGLRYDRNSTNSNLAGNLNVMTPYTQISSSLRRNTTGQTDWSVGLVGGLVLVDQGVVFSPRHIHDTFGVVKVGEQSHIRVESPTGSIWTNYKGLAVVPSLSPYGLNAIKVDTRTLPRQTEIKNAYKVTTPAKASVIPLIFEVEDTRKLMINVSFEGHALSDNLTVFDEEGQFLTLSTTSGRIFLSNIKPKMKLIVQLPDLRECSIVLNLPEKYPKDQLFEKLDEVCQLQEGRI